jgi:hypothetical protein
MLNGKAVVGLSSKEMEQMTDSANHDNKRKMKVSRRDLAYALGTVGYCLPHAIYPTDLSVLAQLYHYSFY